MNQTNQFGQAAANAWHSLMNLCHNDASTPVEVLYRIALIRYLNAIDQSIENHQTGESL